MSFKSLRRQELVDFISYQGLAIIVLVIMGLVYSYIYSFGLNKTLNFFKIKRSTGVYRNACTPVRVEHMNGLTIAHRSAHEVYRGLEQ